MLIECVLPAMGALATSVAMIVCPPALVSNAEKFLLPDTSVESLGICAWGRWW